MDIPVQKTNLLILRGVFPADFTTESGFYDSAVIEVEKNKETQPQTVYTEIPKKFTGVESWITFSNLKCWTCDRKPTTYPKFIPLSPEKDALGNDVCDVEGHFCEWNCVIRYILTEYPPSYQPDLLESVILFESKFSGIRKAKIQPSPPKTEMKDYCGKQGLTPQQWGEKLDRINSDYSLSNYKMTNYRDR